MKAALLSYRVMATVVGVLLIVLVLVGLPLHYLSPDGSQTEGVGDWISRNLGVAHGWLYMVFLIAAFVLSRKAGWDVKFTLVTLVSGTVPILSFWAERRATRRVRDVVSRRSQARSSTTGIASTTGEESRPR